MPERMCKRKTTPPSGLGSVLLDLPRDRYPRRSPEGDHFAWSPSIGDGIMSGRKVSRHIFLEDGGKKKESQGPFPVYSLRAGWVVAASVRKSGRNLINPCQRPVCRSHRGPKPRFSGFEATLRITSGERRGGGCTPHSLRNWGGEAPPKPESPGHIFPLVLARFLVAVGIRSGGTYPLGVPNPSTQVSAKPTPVKIQTVALLPDINWFIKIVERYGAQVQTFQKLPPRTGSVQKGGWGRGDGSND